MRLHCGAALCVFLQTRIFLYVCGTLCVCVHTAVLVCMSGQGWADVMGFYRAVQGGVCMVVWSNIRWAGGESSYEGKWFNMTAACFWLETMYCFPVKPSLRLDVLKGSLWSFWTLWINGFMSRFACKWCNHIPANGVTLSHWSTSGGNAPRANKGNLFSPLRKICIC